MTSTILIGRGKYTEQTSDEQACQAKRSAVINFPAFAQRECCGKLMLRSEV